MVHSGAMTSDESSRQPPYTLLFREAMRGYARGIAGVFAADLIWTTCHSVLSIVLDTTFSYIFTMSYKNYQLQIL